VDGSEVPVGELSFSRLKELRKAGRITDRKPVGRITRLEEILRAAGGRGAMINLDVKEDGVIEPAVRIVRENNMIDQIVFSGCETDRARYLKSHHRECQVLLNVSETQYRVGLADYAEFVRTVCDEAVEAACCGLNVYHTFCNEELIFRAQRRFLPVSVWTVDEAERMKHFLELGVYAITTNRVKALRRLM
jgi:glycerophosphoryl diester phosphodiesterase